VVRVRHVAATVVDLRTFLVNAAFRRVLKVSLMHYHAKYIAGAFEPFRNRTLDVHGMHARRRACPNQGLATPGTWIMMRAVAQGMLGVFA
jgi:hypothetical protein